MSSTVHHFLAELDALSTAAGSIAAAIQSEHSVAPEPATPPGANSSRVGGGSGAAPHTSAGLPDDHALAADLGDVIPSGGDSGRDGGTDSVATGGGVGSSAGGLSASAAGIGRATGSLQEGSTAVEGLDPAEALESGRLIAPAVGLEHLARPAAAGVVTDVLLASGTATFGETAAAAAAAAPSRSGGGVSSGAEVRAGGVGRPRRAWAVEERRRAFAAAALRRCVAKLEGRSGGVGGRPVVALGVPQHVDELIRQAVSVDNLSKMFEGWAGWI